MPNSCHVRSHCVHLSVFLGITLRFISSTLGDVVNLNREADMVSTFFFLDNESLFLFGPFFSCNRRWQMVMRMLGMMQLSRGGEYISNIHLRLRSGWYPSLAIKLKQSMFISALLFYLTRIYFREKFLIFKIQFKNHTLIIGLVISIGHN